MTSRRFLPDGQFEPPSLNPQDAQTSGDLISVYDHSAHSYDGLPRPFSDQNSLNLSSSNFSLSGEFYLPSAPLSMCEMEWADPQAGECNYASHASYYDLPSSGPRNQGSLSSEAVGDGSACPRTWPQLYDPRLAETFCVAARSSEYLIEPTKENCPTLIEDGSPHDYICDDGPQDFSQLRIALSPTMESQLTYASPAAFECKPVMESDLPSSRVSELGDDELGRESLSGSEERVADEPYAKLIYRALLSAPNHSMVLQEIYQWFRDNTDKGSSGTSGWRNSIRHNLSMNAAFRKMDRRISGDETKKTSEWVLEPFAIKVGITPTTRYRIKSNKKAKSETPSRLRIESGRKGGLSTGKHKQRTRDEYNESQAMLRERRRHRLTHIAESRHMSPSTPPGVDLVTSSPYFVNQSPFSFNGVDVKGVYDDGPVFYNSEASQYGDPQSYNMWPQFSQC